MQKYLIAAAMMFFGILLAAQPVPALSGGDIVALKKAGISDETIQVIAEEKIIETAAFSVGDIVKMKQAGLGEETLRMLIRESSFLKNSKPIVYGKHTWTLRLSSAQDIIELKQAGLSDAVIQAVIAVSGDRYDAQREEALDLLQRMGIIVDARDDRRYQKGGH